MTVVLVTGASGFVGRRTLGPLAALGFEVHAAGRREASGAHAFHPVDLLDPAATSDLVAALRPDCVLHLAWFAEHGRFWTASENRDWQAATLALVRAAADAGTRRFVGVGSCAEYDWRDGGAVPRREGDPLAPATLYGEAKAATMAAAADACGAAGMSFAWARLFHLFGRDEPPNKLVASIVASLKRGERAALRSPAALRDHLSVEDAGAALAAIAAGTVEGAINVASGEPARIDALAGLLADLAGRPDLAPGPAETLAPAEVPAMLADVSRLRAEAGVAAPPPLRDRLAGLLVGD